MKFQKQLIQHDPKNGLWGDCFRTCVAVLMGMDAADVPHFHDKYDTLDDPTEVDKAVRSWLKGRGFNIIKICVLAELAEAAIDWFDDVPYILTGASPNIAGVAHCVIGQGAFKTIWDVSPAGKGLAGPWIDENENRVYWAEFIVPSMQ